MPLYATMRFRRSTALAVAPLLLSALLPALLLPTLVGGVSAEPAKALAPIPAATLALMHAKGTDAAAPLVLRSYKKESEIEVWKRNGEGRFVYIKTFPICRWSGQLGPKTHDGDRQTPEGFYPIAARQMNPNSHYYLSFDTGFPNAYDKAHGASGSAVMIHGTCSSRGCFAMTDKQVGELYAIARDALKGGQAAFQLQAYPFHMTARNMALYRNDPNIAFWRQLKEGSDRFESTGEILTTSVVAQHYAFAPSHDPERERQAQAFHADEIAKIAALVKDGSAAVRTTYSDGGQNAIFAALLKKGADLGTVSRPEALAFAGIDVTLVPARPHRRPTPPPADLTVAARPPDAGRPQTTLVKARAVAVPATLDAVATRDAPLHYALFQPPPADALIAGAMPMRAAAMTGAAATSAAVSAKTPH